MSPAKSPPSRVKLTESGVPGFDLILGGGMPAEDLLLIVGPEGSGKTTLSLQMAFHAAKSGRRALFVSTLSEPLPRLARHIRTLGFFDERVIGRELSLVSLYPLVKKGLSDVTESLLKAVREHQATLLILDGLATIRDLHPAAPSIRTFLYDLGVSLAALGCTAVVTSSSIRPHLDEPERTMADGIVELAIETRGTRDVRSIRIAKMRGLGPLIGRHGFRITDAGVDVAPRIESLADGFDACTGTDRVASGMSELDRLMGGGPLQGSTTVLAGAMGTGKTLAALCWVMEAARRGDTALLANFGESRRELVDKARACNLDLEDAIAAGKVVLHHRAPIDLEADWYAWELCRAIDAARPTRIAVDGMGSIEAVANDGGARPGFMASLALLLRKGGLTCLVTKEIEQVIGSELDFSATPLAQFADSVVLLRSVEHLGELCRVISVLKMRSSEFDHSIRQYTIGAAGLTVFDRLESAEGLLTGIARSSLERRR